MISGPIIENGLRFACCQVCGATGWGSNSIVVVVGKHPEPGAVYRCESHLGRNPCAIEGCKRSTDMGRLGYSSEWWLCGEHWKRFVPPRSARRRAYLALRRKGRKADWPEELIDRYWRMLGKLIRMARRRAESGHLDLAEIDRLFG